MTDPSVNEVSCWWEIQAHWQMPQMGEVNEIYFMAYRTASNSTHVGTKTKLWHQTNPLSIYQYHYRFQKQILEIEAWLGRWTVWFDEHPGIVPIEMVLRCLPSIPPVHLVYWELLTDTVKKGDCGWLLLCESVSKVPVWLQPISLQKILGTLYY